VFCYLQREVTCSLDQDFAKFNTAATASTEASPAHQNIVYNHGCKKAEDFAR